MRYPVHYRDKLNVIVSNACGVIENNDLVEANDEIEILMQATLQNVIRKMLPLLKASEK